jgi:hypothetical protein
MARNLLRQKLVICQRYRFNAFLGESRGRRAYASHDMLAAPMQGEVNSRY